MAAGIRESVQRRKGIGHTDERMLGETAEISRITRPLHRSAVCAGSSGARIVAPRHVPQHPTRIAVGERGGEQVARPRRIGFGRRSCLGCSGADSIDSPWAAQPSSAALAQAPAPASAAFVFRAHHVPRREFARRAHFGGGGDLAAFTGERPTTVSMVIRSSCRSRGRSASTSAGAMSQ